MSDLSAPQLDHHVIPIPGRSPVVLIGLEVSPPEPVEIILAIDLSDSCGDLSKIFSHTRKLLGQLPGDWPLQVFRLSSPAYISRPDLRLLDLCESTHWLKELCVGQDLHQMGARSGSFLRPVLEALQSVSSSSPRLLLVLTDGQLSDFGEVGIPAGVEVVGVVPHSNRGGNGSVRPIQKQVKFLSIQDPQLDHVIIRYSHPFYGPVIVEPKPISAKNDCLYRADPEGRLIAWSRMPNHIVNLASGRQYVLFDGTLEESQTIRWKLKSCSNESVKVLQGTEPAKQSKRSFEKKIIYHFTQAASGHVNEVICWLQRDDPHFSSLAEQFQSATKLSELREPWIDDDGKLLVFSQAGDRALASDDGQSQHHGILAVVVSCRQTKVPLHLGLLSLRREQTPAIHFQPGSSFNGLTTDETVEIKFDQHLYRWVLSATQRSGGKKDLTCELEYYAAEKLELALSHAEGDVTVLFSGHLS